MAGAISSYQRHVSPRKGFACAYRVATGRCSCSEFARRLVHRVGTLTSARLLAGRFRRCGEASAALSESAEQKPKSKRPWHDPFSRNQVEGAGCASQACCLWPF
jgi:putative component of membrane protein insertase Oxa1/YidC/SpoIIIJ protein YidD